MKKDLIICDIDGVIVDISWIFQDEQFNAPDKTPEEKWDFFNRNANNMDNKINYDVVEIINRLKFFGGYKIAFVTSRSDIIYKSTLNMLHRIFVFDDILLLMRKEGDLSPSSLVKDRILADLNKKYKIICAIDDDPTNCAMFRGNGITTMQVV
ncbi:MAG: HAD family acid phosphatase [Candidatus Gastranaerophilales bacterium]|nr:HAD family acid phosphatase [Candidatus Gastranaerophilales bacterium]